MLRTLTRPGRILIALLIIGATEVCLATSYGGSKTPFIGDNKLGGFWAYLGVDVGYSWLKTGVSGETNKQGLDSNVAGLITYYRKRALFELGGRFNYRSINGNRSSGEFVFVDSMSVAIEASIRLRFGEQFHIGPYFQYHFGKDLSFKPASNPILSGEPNKDTAMVAGLQWIFETRRGYTPMRFGLRVQRYLNVPNDRMVVGALVTYQVGFRIFDGNKPDFTYNTHH